MWETSLRNPIAHFHQVCRREEERKRLTVNWLVPVGYDDDDADVPDPIRINLLFEFRIVSMHRRLTLKTIEDVIGLITVSRQEMIIVFKRCPGLRKC